MSHSKLVLMYYVKCYNSAYNILRTSEWPEILANILAWNFLKQVVQVLGVLLSNSVRAVPLGGTP